MCLPFIDAEGLRSQPSTFFGTHTSYSTCPRTPCRLRLSRLGMLNISGCGPSLLSWYSMELGRKNWSVGSIGARLSLPTELAAVLGRLEVDGGVSLCSLVPTSYPLSCLLLM